MRPLDSSPPKYHNLSRTLNFILVSLSLGIIYLLVSISLVGSSKLTSQISFSTDNNVRAPTNLGHIVFGIASNEKAWTKKREYVKLWWKPEQMQGCVFLESMPTNEDYYNETTSSLPPVCISEDTSRFRYTYRNGLRSAIRVARVVVETVALNHSNVRWYVFGDDDTLFIPDNLVKTLSKYDDRMWYYIGSNSEVYEQNRIFGFEMAYGGAGFAISYPLAKVLAKIFDSCIQRYPHLYGSDSRISSCLAELGVGLTREPGFHQVDFQGNVFGLLTSHPLSPLVSLHHLDYIDPIFPNKTRLNSLQHLFKAVAADSQRILQRTVCYDQWYSWTISISWGYAVEVYGKHLLLPDILPVQNTFKQWRKGSVLASTYVFNVRENRPHPCQNPTAFFLDRISLTPDGHGITAHYNQNYVNCSHDIASPTRLEEIIVHSHKLDLTHNQEYTQIKEYC
ncbi:uncharacterized protein [Euphorbia lathyris]|uniref:uncharacterized protein isoform X2 n=1 Tax=Euphorbia lathyris TaxID=212925 RepID=UPI00331345DB